jgi:pimeloyl-ACP methyl ester carboxylesterase
MTIEALAGDVVALLDHLGIARADLFGFSLGGLVAVAVALGAPARVGKLVIASADPHRPPGGESVPPGQDRLPTPADFQAWREAYHAVAPDPAHFEEFAARESALVHQCPGWTGELRALQAPVLLIFGDRDFSPLPDVVELSGLLPGAQLAAVRRPGKTRRTAGPGHQGPPVSSSAEMAAPSPSGPGWQPDAPTISAPRSPAGSSRPRLRGSRWPASRCPP